MDFEDGIARDLVGAATRAAEETAELVRDDLRESISVPSGPGFRSAPYSPPGMDTGDYYESIQNDVVVGDDVVTFIVYTDELLGLWLEKGTHNADGSDRMLPRPHFAPCAERAEPILNQRLGAAVDEVTA